MHERQTETERERKGERERERQTDRQTGRQTDRQDYFKLAKFSYSNTSFFFLLNIIFLNHKFTSGQISLIPNVFENVFENN